MAETGKQRAARIPLDYFKKPDFYAKWKNRLGLGALAITIVWLSAGLLQRGQGEMRFSRGPVAQVHAIWDAQCTACHTPFEAISEHNWIATVFGTSGTGSEGCKACHAGPPHHKSAKQEPSCAACHREHQGRDASLVRLPDQDCTRCHADLRRHTNVEKLEIDGHVTAFSEGTHPKFRSLEKKPSRGLKFSHKTHMLPGMAASFTVGKLGDADKKRYAPGLKDSDPVRLDCQSCHRLDSADFLVKSERKGESSILGLKHKEISAPFRPRGGVGDYMVPITYENQCKACHPVTLSLANAPDAFKLKDKTVPIPHGLQPAEVKQFVWGVLAQYGVQKLIKDWQPPLDRPLPGKSFSEAEKKARERIDAIVRDQVEAFLYRDAVSQADKLHLLGAHTCGRCHELTGERDAKTIVPTQVPNVWFKHAKFSHAKHRGLDCRACHGEAEKSHTEGNVLIPNIDNCLNCHGTHVSGGARSDCTECHTYHHRGEAKASGIGLGASARDPVERFKDLQEFIKATPNKKK